MKGTPVKGPVETKVAAGGSSGVLVTLLFGLAANYHWFTPPPPYLTALVVTAVTFASGWLAPHTPRAAPATPTLVEQMSGPLVSAAPPTVAAAGSVRSSATGPVQPPATTTGPMT